MSETSGTYDIQYPTLNLIVLHEWLRVGLVGLAIIFVWFNIWNPIPFFNLIVILATLFGGYPIFNEAFESLMKKQMTMELSMTIALISALLIEEYLTTLIIIFFVLIAEILEKYTVSKGRTAIQTLINLLPQIAYCMINGIIVEKKIKELQVNDTVLVKPGSRVPVDGIVLTGNSFLDQSTITGESLPVEKLPGSLVYAGTMNKSGLLEICTTSIGSDTAFGRIINQIEQVEKNRAPVQKLADKLASYLVYYAIICAILTFIVTKDIRSTISVIIVAGACGIAAGTPLAILGAIGYAARKGVIIKGGIYLEELSRIDTIALDKTGTLTLGELEVINVFPKLPYDIDFVLQTAMMVENYSEHPLAKAIIKKWGKEQQIPEKPINMEFIPGKGIIGVLKNSQKILVGNRIFFEENKIDTTTLNPCPNYVSEVLVGIDRELLGSIHLTDVLRPESLRAIQLLKNMKYDIALLTGDKKEIAFQTANNLGVDEVRAELLPYQKLTWIEERIKKGDKVMMVGDGINDSLALIQANIGVAMGSGTDLARETAHILLLGNDLLKLIDTIAVSKKCKRIIFTNFIGTLLVDTLGIILAAFGYLNPILAAWMHVGSELLFILNSARLITGNRTKKKTI